MYLQSMPNNGFGDAALPLSLQHLLLAILPPKNRLSPGVPDITGSHK